MRTKILLALLIVVLVCVALAWHFAQNETMAPARVDMRSTLRNLADAESVYFEAHHAFTADVAELQSAAHFKPASGVSLAIDRADSTAWHATVRHRRSSEVCSLGGPVAAKVGEESRGPDCR